MKWTYMCWLIVKWWIKQKCSRHRKGLHSKSLSKRSNHFIYHDTKNEWKIDFGIKRTIDGKLTNRKSIRLSYRLCGYGYSWLKCLLSAWNMESIDLRCTHRRMSRWLIDLNLCPWTLMWLDTSDLVAADTIASFSVTKKIENRKYYNFTRWVHFSLAR